MLTIKICLLQVKMCLMDTIVIYPDVKTVTLLYIFLLIRQLYIVYLLLFYQVKCLNIMMKTWAVFLVDKYNV